MAKVLVVDDSKLAAKMIEDRLLSKGYKVSVVFSGEEAGFEANADDYLVKPVVPAE